LSSVIAYPVLGLGYTILRQLFNAILMPRLTKKGINWCQKPAGATILFPVSVPVVI
jgi:hypothetical protein